MAEGDVTGAGGPAELLGARHVAVVGASPGKHYSTSVLANLRANGVDEDHLWLVNPGRNEVDGTPCHHALADLPVRPDLVVSLVGTAYVDGVLDEVVAAGVPGMMVVADGFAESGPDGIARQASLVEKARRHAVALLGPNSLGFVAPGAGLAAWIGGRLPDLTPGNLALVFQSSGMLNLVMGQVGRRRIGISGAISVGNEAVLDLADFVRHYAADPATDVIGIVLESTTRPRALASALHAATAAGKRLIVLSIGKSERGMKNVASHAGRMATGAKVWEALFRQVGAVAVEDLADFLDSVALAAHLPATASADGLALVTISGGETGLLSDLAEGVGLELAGVSAASQRRLDELLGRHEILANPLDVRNTRTSAPEVFWGCLETLATDPAVDIVALRMNFAPTLTPALEQMYADIAAAVARHGARCVFMSRVQETYDPAWYALFHRLGVPFLVSYGGALKAFAHLQEQSRHASLVASEARFDAVPEAVVEPVGSSSADWRETQEWLADHGIPYVASRLVTDPAAAVEAATELGFPVVVKGVVTGLAHKSEHQLVHLGLGDADAVRAAVAQTWTAVTELAAEGGEGGAIEVQAMAAGGQEFFLGAHRDPILGPVLSFGLGGIFLEVLRDVVYALPPVTADQAEQLLRALRGWPLLVGARGQAPADVAALAQLVSRASLALAEHAGESAAPVTGLDLNPVMVLPVGQGVLAVDAYLERGSAPTDPVRPEETP